jgi:hypothetical protein
MEKGSSICTPISSMPAWQSGAQRGTQHAARGARGSSAHVGTLLAERQQLRGADSRQPTAEVRALGARAQAR